MAKRVLVVDDERSIVRLTQINLERAGYEVTTAFDGIEALEAVTDQPPDLIVLDWIMPRKDGKQVLHDLQADPRYRDIPVVMLTGKAQDADVFKGWSSGITAYLTKPFDPHELLVFVSRIFEAQEHNEG